MEQYYKAIEQFQIVGDVLSIEPYGEGHINETYLAVMKNGDKTTDYILQKINNKIFKIGFAKFGKCQEHQLKTDIPPLFR